MRLLERLFYDALKFNIQQEIYTLILSSLKTDLPFLISGHYFPEAALNKRYNIGKSSLFIYSRYQN